MEKRIWCDALIFADDTFRFAFTYKRINVFVQNGMSALHYAAKCGHIDVCELLLQRHADTNDKTVVRVYYFMKYYVCSRLKVH